MNLIFCATLVMISNTGCNSHDTIVKKGDIVVTYKKGISRLQAEKTSNVLFERLNEIVYPVIEIERSKIQVEKGQGDTLVLKIIPKNIQLNEIEHGGFRGLAGLLSTKVFGKKPVNIVILDHSQKELMTLRFVILVDEEVDIPPPPLKNNR